MKSLEKEAEKQLNAIAKEARDSLADTALVRAVDPSVRPSFVLRTTDGRVYQLLQLSLPEPLQFFSATRADFRCLGGNRYEVALRFPKIEASSNGLVASILAGAANDFLATSEISRVRATIDVVGGTSVAGLTWLLKPDPCGLRSIEFLPDVPSTPERNAPSTRIVERPSLPRFEGSRVEAEGSSAASLTSQQLVASPSMSPANAAVLQEVAPAASPSIGLSGNSQNLRLDEGRRIGLANDSASSLDAEKVQDSVELADSDPSTPGAVTSVAPPSSSPAPLDLDPRRAGTLTSVDGSFAECTLAFSNRPVIGGKVLIERRGIAVARAQILDRGRSAGSLEILEEFGPGNPSPGDVAVFEDR